MPVRKLDNGQWVADFYTVDRSNGKRGKRVRKNLPPKVKRWRLKITPSRKWRTHPGLVRAKTNAACQI